MFLGPRPGDILPTLSGSSKIMHIALSRATYLRGYRVSSQSVPVRWLPYYIIQYGVGNVERLLRTGLEGMVGVVIPSPIPIATCQ